MTLDELSSAASASNWHVGDAMGEASLAALLKEVQKRLSSDAQVTEAWFRSVAQQLLEVDNGSAVLQHVEILILLSDWFEDNLDRSLALRLLEHARDVSCRSNTLALKRRVLNTLGTFHNRQRNVPAATICYVEALKLAEQLGDRLGRCAVLANMAVLRLNMGMVDDAAKLAKFVIDLCADESVLSTLKCQAHHCLAEANLVLSQPDTAYEHGMAALKLAPHASNKLNVTKRVLLEATLVRASIASGNLRNAVKHTQSACEFAAIADTYTARVQSQLSLALCEVAQGCTDLALTRLATLEGLIAPTDMSFRDFLQIGLTVNLSAGRKRYAQHYNKKYLSSVAEYQRRSALEQVAGVKRLLKRAERVHSAATVHGEPLSSNGGLDFVRVFSAQMDALATLAELREDATGEHSYRVGVNAAAIARAIGYSDADVEVIERAARLHDIGKLATPDAILLKPGKLTPYERDVVERHSTEGSQILADILYTVEATEIRQANKIANGLRLAAEIAQCHHERWDGSGYPRGLSENSIPEAARVVAIADVYDELTHARPYKKSITKIAALRQIQALSGRQFDPKLCREFVAVVEQMNEPPERAGTEITPFDAANRVIKRMVADTR
jgi:putative two-component system response regulator